MRTSVVVMCCALMGCADSGEFGVGFIWGSATAGFQVDMGCPTLTDTGLFEDTQSDWYQWVTDPESVNDGRLYITGDPVSIGPVCGRPLKRTWPA